MPDENRVSLEAKSPFELRVDLSATTPEETVKEALKTGDMGFMHSFTTGSCVDGPGVRLVAWLTGCQFRCVYCHNPDTWKMKNGIPVPLEAAKAELSKYRHGLKVMKGGFTISGGEPLLQDRFVIKLFSAAKEMGIHTALDTNGFMHARLNDEELKKIDLVMLCIKAWNSELHQRLTGLEAGPALDFARRLAHLKRPMWLRYVLVPGLTDTTEEVSQMADFAASLGNVERVDLLPFHQMGEFKWKKLAMDYQLEDVRPPSQELIDQTKARFQAAGLKAL